MRAPATPAAHRAIALFRDAPRADRWHVRARWWSAPFPRIEAHVPVSGTVLEVGAGHGLLSLYLGVTGPKRIVRGVDIDARKIEIAQQAARRLEPGEADVAFDLVGPDEFPDGYYDAIVIADVLYLLAPDARARLLDRCVDALSPDGVLLVKETDHRRRWKGRLTVLQERLATRVLGITAGEHVEFAGTAELEAQLQARGLRTEEWALDDGYIHPHHLIAARKWAPPRPTVDPA